MTKGFFEQVIGQIAKVVNLTEQNYIMQYDKK